MQIICHTQSEVDAALKSQTYEDYIIIDSDPREKIVLSGASQAELRGASHAELLESSHAELRESSHAELRGSSYAEAKRE